MRDTKLCAWVVRRQLCGKPQVTFRGLWIVVCLRDAPAQPDLGIIGIALDSLSQQRVGIGKAVRARRLADSLDYLVDVAHSAGQLESESSPPRN